MTDRRRVGALGAVAGVVAVGAAAGLAAERYAVGRSRLRPDPEAREPFFALPADRVRRVIADDGLPLHVEEVGPEGPVRGPTVVFAHGYTQQLAVWHYQRQALAADNPGRLVFYDQRSHGKSGRSVPERSTIDQLGRDLYAVLAACAPRGPIVLVGHSMGGMSIMALARQRPDLFGTRVVGVFLLATSASGLVETGILGWLVTIIRRLRLLPLYLRGLQLVAPLLERRRRRGSRFGRWFTRRLLFGADDADPGNVRLVQDLLEETPWPVAMAFYATFLDHDETAALEVLRRVPVTVVAATHDRLTPVDHGRRVAAALGEGAELVVVPGAGHSVNLTRGPIVDDALTALLDRIAAARENAG